MLLLMQSAQGLNGTSFVILFQTYVKLVFCSSGVSVCSFWQRRLALAGTISGVIYEYMYT